MSTPLPPHEHQQRSQKFIAFRDELRHGSADNFEQWYEAYAAALPILKKKKRKTK
jgi:hypothetical protein